MQTDWKPLLEIDDTKITRSEAHEMLLEHEKLADQWLETGKISQKDAWDMYFGLLHACDEWRFYEDRPRILAKIDTKRYNPFESERPDVVLLARTRALGLGLTGTN